MDKSIRHIFRIAAIMVLVCFITQDIAWAYPDFRRANTNTLAQETLITSPDRMVSLARGTAAYIVGEITTRFGESPLARVPNVFALLEEKGFVVSGKPEAEEIIAHLPDGFLLRCFVPRPDLPPDKLPEGTRFVKEYPINRYLCLQLLTTVESMAQATTEGSAPRQNDEELDAILNAPLLIGKLYEDKDSREIYGSVMRVMDHIFNNCAKPAREKTAISAARKGFVVLRERFSTLANANTKWKFVPRTEFEDLYNIAFEGMDSVRQEIWNLGRELHKEEKEYFENSMNEIRLIISKDVIPQIEIIIKAYDRFESLGADEQEKRWRDISMAWRKLREAKNNIMSSERATKFYFDVIWQNFEINRASRTRSLSQKLRDVIIAATLKVFILRWLAVKIQSALGEKPAARKILFFLLPLVKWIQAKFVIQTSNDPDEATEVAAKEISAKRDEKIAIAIDSIGDSAESEEEARFHVEHYLTMMRTLSEKVSAWESDPFLDHGERLQFAVKLSAIVYGAHNREKGEYVNKAKIKDTLKTLVRAAAEANATIYIDPEEYAYRDFGLEVYKEVVEELAAEDASVIFMSPESGALRMGIGVQAYLKDSGKVLYDLFFWASGKNYRMPVRLVKGAYDDKEKEWAVLGGYPSPVFKYKESTDAHFELLTEFLIKHNDRFRIAIASHNIHSLAKAIALADKYKLSREEIEIQMLYGMGDPVKKAIIAFGCRVRAYVPIGSFIAGFKYCARRLKELVNKDNALTRTMARDYKFLKELRDREPYFKRDDLPTFIIPEMEGKVLVARRAMRTADGKELINEVVYDERGRRKEVIDRNGNVLEEYKYTEEFGDVPAFVTLTNVKNGEKIHLKLAERPEFDGRQNIRLRQFKYRVYDPTTGKNLAYGLDYGIRYHDTDGKNADCFEARDIDVTPLKESGIGTTLMNWFVTMAEEEGVNVTDSVTQNEHAVRIYYTLLKKLSVHIPVNEIKDDTGEIQKVEWEFKNIPLEEALGLLRQKRYFSFYFKDGIPNPIRIVKESDGTITRYQNLDTNTPTVTEAKEFTFTKNCMALNSFIQEALGIIPILNRIDTTSIFYRFISMTLFLFLGVSTILPVLVFDLKPLELYLLNFPNISVGVEPVVLIVMLLFYPFYKNTPVKSEESRDYARDLFKFVLLSGLVIYLAFLAASAYEGITEYFYFKNPLNHPFEEVRTMPLYNTIFVKPICEEIVSRGALFGLLRWLSGKIFKNGKLVFWTAAIMSSALFISIHDFIDNPILVIIGMMFSLGFAYVYHKTGRISIPIMMHSAWNAIVLFPSTSLTNIGMVVAVLGMVWLLLGEFLDSSAAGSRERTGTPKRSMRRKGSAPPYFLPAVGMCVILALSTLGGQKAVLAWSVTIGAIIFALALYKRRSIVSFARSKLPKRLARGIEAVLFYHLVPPARVRNVSDRLRKQSEGPATVIGVFIGLAILPFTALLDRIKQHFSQIRKSRKYFRSRKNRNRRDAGFTLRSGPSGEVKPFTSVAEMYRELGMKPPLNIVKITNEVLVKATKKGGVRYYVNQFRERAFKIRDNKIPRLYASLKSADKWVRAASFMLLDAFIRTEYGRSVCAKYGVDTACLDDLREGVRAIFAQESLMASHASSQSRQTADMQEPREAVKVFIDKILEAFKELGSEASAGSVAKWLVNRGILSPEGKIATSNSVIGAINDNGLESQIAELPKAGPKVAEYDRKLSEINKGLADFLLGKNGIELTPVEIGILRVLSKTETKLYTRGEVQEELHEQGITTARGREVSQIIFANSVISINKILGEFGRAPLTFKVLVGAIPRRPIPDELLKAPKKEKPGKKRKGGFTILPTVIIVTLGIAAAVLAAFHGAPGLKMYFALGLILAYLIGMNWFASDSNISPRKSRIAVVALDESAFKDLTRTAGEIAGLVEDGYKVVVTYDNISELEKLLVEHPGVSLAKLIRETQVTMGRVLKEAIESKLREQETGKGVESLFTEVQVDPADPAFNNPTKLIGQSFMVPSPKPARVLKTGRIVKSLMMGNVVIAAGGGGIAVDTPIAEKKNELSCVIDKDRTSSLLARQLDASLFVILADEPKVLVDQGKPEARGLFFMTAGQARRSLEEGRFPRGETAAKVEAMTEFVEKTGRRAIITDPGNLFNSTAAKAGTHILGNIDKHAERLKRAMLEMYPEDMPPKEVNRHIAHVNSVTAFAAFYARGFPEISKDRDLMHLLNLSILALNVRKILQSPAQAENMFIDLLDDKLYKEGADIPEGILEVIEKMTSSDTAFWEGDDPTISLMTDIVAASEKSAKHYEVKIITSETPRITNLLMDLRREADKDAKESSKVLWKSLRGGIDRSDELLTGAVIGGYLGPVVQEAWRKLEERERADSGGSIGNFLGLYGPPWTWPREDLGFLLGYAINDVEKKENLLDFIKAQDEAFVGWAPMADNLVFFMQRLIAECSSERNNLSPEEMYAVAAAIFYPMRPSMAVSRPEETSDIVLGAADEIHDDDLPMAEMLNGVMRGEFTLSSAIPIFNMEKLKSASPQKAKLIASAMAEALLKSAFSPEEIDKDPTAYYKFLSDPTEFAAWAGLQKIVTELIEYYKRNDSENKNIELLENLLTRLNAVRVLKGGAEVANQTGRLVMLGGGDPDIRDVLVRWVFHGSDMSIEDFKAHFECNADEVDTEDKLIAWILNNNFQILISGNSNLDIVRGNSLFGADKGEEDEADPHAVGTQDTVEAYLKMGQGLAKIGGKEADPTSSLMLKMLEGLAAGKVSLSDAVHYLGLYGILDFKKSTHSPRVIAKMLLQSCFNPDFIDTRPAELYEVFLRNDKDLAAILKMEDFVGRLIQYFLANDFEYYKAKNLDVLKALLNQLRAMRFVWTAAELAAKEKRTVNIGVDGNHAKINEVLFGWMIKSPGNPQKTFYELKWLFGCVAQNVYSRDELLAWLLKHNFEILVNQNGEFSVQPRRAPPEGPDSEGGIKASAPVLATLLAVGIADIQLGLMLFGLAAIIMTATFFADGEGPKEQVLIKQDDKAALIVKVGAALNGLDEFYLRQGGTERLLEDTEELFLLAAALREIQKKNSTEESDIAQIVYTVQALLEQRKDNYIRIQYHLYNDGRVEYVFNIFIGEIDPALKLDDLEGMRCFHVIHHPQENRFELVGGHLEEVQDGEEAEETALEEMISKIGEAEVSHIRGEKTAEKIIEDLIKDRYLAEAEVITRLSHAWDIAAFSEFYGEAFRQIVSSEEALANLRLASLIISLGENPSESMEIFRDALKEKDVEVSPAALEVVEELVTKCNEPDKIKDKTTQLLAQILFAGVHSASYYAVDREPSIQGLYGKLAQMSSSALARPLASIEKRMRRYLRSSAKDGSPKLATLILGIYLGPRAHEVWQIIESGGGIKLQIGKEETSRLRSPPWVWSRKNLEKLLQRIDNPEAREKLIKKILSAKYKNKDLPAIDRIIILAEDIVDELKANDLPDEKAAAILALVFYPLRPETIFPCKGPVNPEGLFQIAEYATLKIPDDQTITQMDDEEREEFDRLVEILNKAAGGETTLAKAVEELTRQSSHLSPVLEANVLLTSLFHPEIIDAAPYSYLNLIKKPEDLKALEVLKARIEKLLDNFAGREDLKEKRNLLKRLYDRVCVLLLLRDVVLRISGGERLMMTLGPKDVEGSKVIFEWMLKHVKKRVELFKDIRVFKAVLGCEDPAVKNSAQLLKWALKELKTVIFALLIDKKGNIKVGRIIRSIIVILMPVIGIAWTIATGDVQGVQAAVVGVFLGNLRLNMLLPDREAIPQLTDGELYKLLFNEEPGKTEENFRTVYGNEFGQLTISDITAIEDALSRLPQEARWVAERYSYAKDRKANLGVLKAPFKGLKAENKEQVDAIMNSSRQAFFTLLPEGLRVKLEADYQLAEEKPGSSRRYHIGWPGIPYGTHFMFFLYGLSEKACQLREEEGRDKTIQIVRNYFINGKDLEKTAELAGMDVNKTASCLKPFVKNLWHILPRKKIKAMLEDGIDYIFVVKWRGYMVICTREALSEILDYLKPESKRLFISSTELVPLERGPAISLPERFVEAFKGTKEFTLVERPGQRLIELWPQELSPELSPSEVDSRVNTPAVEKRTLEDIIRYLRAENKEGRYPEGIEILGYPVRYKDLAIYYLLRDIRDKFDFKGDISPRSSYKIVNGIIGQDVFQAQQLPVRQFFVLKGLLEELYLKGSLSQYGKLNKLYDLVVLYQTKLRDAGLDVDAIWLDALIYLIHSKPDVMSILGIEGKKDQQLESWNLPRVQLTVEHFQAIVEILKEKYKNGTLKEYGGRDARGLVKLLGEIEKNEASAYKTLRGINLGQLTRLIKLKANVVALLGIEDEKDPQIQSWDMPFVNLPWESYKAIAAILKDKYESGTLKEYGSKDGKGLVKLLGEIERTETDVYKKLKGINLGHLTALINSKDKVMSILGIKNENDPQVQSWDMPKVDLTWKQYQAIAEILKDKYKAGTLREYGDRDAKGLVKLLSEIETGKTDAYKKLKGLHLCRLTDLINSKDKVMSILGIEDGNDPQIQLWNMPRINLTWKQYKAITAILKIKYKNGTLKEYGSKDGKGLEKLVVEIEGGETETYKALRGVHLYHLTVLISPRNRVMAIIGIEDEKDPEIESWQMPFVNMTWKRYIERLKQKPSTPSGFISQGETAFKRMAQSLRKGEFSDVTENDRIKSDIAEIERRVNPEGKSPADSDWATLQKLAGSDRPLRIFAANEVIISGTDFSFGFYSHAPPVKKKLINIFGSVEEFNRVFPEPTIVLFTKLLSCQNASIRQEAILHEAICYNVGYHMVMELLSQGKLKLSMGTIKRLSNEGVKERCQRLGHYMAIFEAQKYFSENYRKGEYESSGSGLRKFLPGHLRDLRMPFKGDLGRFLRETIDDVMSLSKEERLVSLIAPAAVRFDLKEYGEPREFPEVSYHDGVFHKLIPIVRQNGSAMADMHDLELVINAHIAPGVLERLFVLNVLLRNHDTNGENIRYYLTENNVVVPVSSHGAGWVESAIQEGAKDIGSFAAEFYWIKGFRRVFFHPDEFSYIGGFIRKNMLASERVYAAIAYFQSMDDEKIERYCVEAGYSGEELDRIAALLKANRDTLMEDVEYLLKYGKKTLSVIARAEYLYNEAGTSISRGQYFSGISQVKEIEKDAIALEDEFGEGMKGITASELTERAMAALTTIIHQLDARILRLTSEDQLKDLARLIRDLKKKIEDDFKTGPFERGGAITRLMGRFDELLECIPEEKKEERPKTVDILENAKRLVHTTVNALVTAGYRICRRGNEGQIEVISGASREKGMAETEKRKLGIFIDERLGRGKVDEIRKALEELTRRGDILGRFLENVVIYSAETNAGSLEYMESKKNVKKEDMVIITTEEENACLNDYTSSVITKVNDGELDSDSYYPLLEVVLFSLARSNALNFTREELVHFLRSIPNINLTGLNEEGIMDLVWDKGTNGAKRVVAIYLGLPDAEEITGDAQLYMAIAEYIRRNA